jgi:hypothetical protein
MRDNRDDAAGLDKKRGQINAHPAAVFAGPAGIAARTVAASIIGDTYSAHGIGGTTTKG